LSIALLQHCFDSNATRNGEDEIAELLATALAEIKSESSTLSALLSHGLKNTIGKGSSLGGGEGES
jgi:hypothetical protein